MKNGKSNFGFSYLWNMANFEAFCRVISSSINLLFLKSVIAAPLLLLLPSFSRRRKKTRIFFCVENWLITLYVMQKSRKLRSSKAFFHISRHFLLPSLNLDWVLFFRMDMYISPVFMSPNDLPHSLNHGYWHKNTWFGPFLGFSYCGTSYRHLNFGPRQL